MHRAYAQDVYEPNMRAVLAKYYTHSNSTCTHGCALYQDCGKHLCRSDCTHTFFACMCARQVEGHADKARYAPAHSFEDGTVLYEAAALVAVNYEDLLTA